MASDTVVYTDVSFASNRERHHRLTAIASLLVVGLNGLFWGWMAHRFDAPLMMAVNLVFAALALPLLLLSNRLPRRILHHAAVILAFSFVWTYVIAIEGVPGVPFPTLNHWWFLGIAVAALLLFSDSSWWMWGYTLLTTCSFIICELGLIHVGPLQPPSAAFLAGAAFMQAGTHITVFVAVLLLAGVFVTSIASAEKHLYLANGTLESLLENMLPKSIAERLRREGKTFADGYAECSVLFVDLAGFTALASGLAPRDLVRLLDEIFSRFDELTEHFGLEKIKTIGDAYMVAAGIPEPRTDHAQACVRLATAMRSVIREYAGLRVRIGINSGGVVAGVIGKRRFIYDLWGDTVNIASRMESHGIVDEIQVSEQTAQLISDEYETKPRGQIEIKGKGRMPVYLVVGRKTSRVESAL